MYVILNDFVVSTELTLQLMPKSLHLLNTNLKLILIPCYENKQINYYLMPIVLFINLVINYKQ